MGRLRPLFGNRPWAVRRLQPQRSMGSVAVVIVHVLPQDGAEMPLVDHDAMVEAFAPQRADTPFGDGVGLRSADGCENRPDPEAGGARDEVAAVTGVAVSDQIARPLAPRGRLEDLLPDPGRRGMPGDVPVLDAPHAGLRLRRRLAARDARHRAADAGTRAFLVRHRQPGPLHRRSRGGGRGAPPPRGPRGHRPRHSLREMDEADHQCHVAGGGLNARAVGRYGCSRGAGHAGADAALGRGGRGRSGHTSRGLVGNAPRIEHAGAA